MMGEAAAVRVAIDLVQVPSRVRLIRQAPLPDGMVLLLGITAGDGAALDQAARLTGRAVDVVSRAAAFFIEQILLSPDADSYRVLGARPDTPSAELRRNMALLVRWLHPDVANSADRSLFAGRVTLAWDDLKTPQRRAAYDRAMSAAPQGTSPRRPKAGGSAAAANAGSKKRPKTGRRSNMVSKTGLSLDIYQPERTGLVRRALLRLFGWPRP